MLRINVLDSARLDLATSVASYKDCTSAAVDEVAIPAAEMKG